MLRRDQLISVFSLVPFISIIVVGNILLLSKLTLKINSLPQQSIIISIHESSSLTG